MEFLFMHVNSYRFLSAPLRICSLLSVGFEASKVFQRNAWKQAECLNMLDATRFVRRRPFRDVGAS